MKPTSRSKKFLKRYWLLILALLAPLAILLPRIASIVDGASATEKALLQSGVDVATAPSLSGHLHVVVTGRPLTVLFGYGLHLLRLNYVTVRLINVMLIVITILFAYKLFRAWLGGKTARLSALLASCIPVFLLAQFVSTTVALMVMLLTLGLYCFDAAGRRRSAVGWYALAGVSFSLAWLQDPLATSIVLLVAALTLVASKPRYIRHIARQSLLIPIIMLVLVGTILGLDTKFSLGFTHSMATALNASLSGAPLARLMHLYSGVTQYYAGLPGTGLVSSTMLILLAVGLWRMIVGSKRPRNRFLIIFPILLLLIAIQIQTISALVLFCLAALLVTPWIAIALRYLIGIWLRVFPENKATSRIMYGFMGVLVASMVWYSFWYVQVAWRGNPTVQSEAQQQGDMSL